MKPTDILMQEHQVILGVLEAALQEARTMDATGEVDAERLDKMVEFFRSFADHCHHAKEEKELFALMEQRGLPAEGGPISVMLTEHDEGRRHVRALAEAAALAREGDTSAAASAARELQAFVKLLRNHILKEDTVLYPLADQILTDEDQSKLAEAFERIEREEVGAGIHEKYYQLARELTQE